MPAGSLLNSTPQFRTGGVGGPSRIWRVQITGGSAASPSHCGALLRAAAIALTAAGAQVSAWDIGDRQLPAAGAPQRGIRAAGFVRAVRHAHALVLVTPLYHNSFSGLVKNAIDHLAERDLHGKPVALMSTTGGMPSPQALDHLRLVVRSLHGVALPSQVVAIDDNFELVEGRYQVSSQDLIDRVCDVVRELLWFSERLSPQADEPSDMPRAARAAEPSREQLIR
jgi:azobenzene reductase